MKHFYLLLAVIVLPFTVFAQSNYHRGHIIQAGGDTVKGYINYRNWGQNPRYIEFKASKDVVQPTQYKPAQIREFEVTGYERYVTYEGLISIDKTIFPDLPDSLDISTKQDTIFLRTIFQGSQATLFAYIDKIKTRYFVREGNNTPVELIFHNYYNSEKSKVLAKETYKQQLIRLAFKLNMQNNKLSTNISKMAYTESDLLKLFKQLNANDTVSTKKLRTSGSWWYIGGALDRTKTLFGDDYRRKIYGSLTYAPRVWGGFEVSVNPNVQRIVFRVELALSYAALNYTFSDYFGKTEQRGYDQYMASLSPNVLWNIYNTDKLKFYLGLGANLNFTTYTNVNSPYMPEKLWTNFPISAGIVLNRKLDLGITYTGKTSYSAYNIIYFQNQTSSLGIRYRLGQKK